MKFALVVDVSPLSISISKINLQTFASKVIRHKKFKDKLKMKNQLTMHELVLRTESFLKTFFSTYSNVSVLDRIDVIVSDKLTNEYIEGLEVVLDRLLPGKHVLISFVSAFFKQCLSVVIEPSILYLYVGEVSSCFFYEKSENMIICNTLKSEELEFLSIEDLLLYELPEDISKFAIIIDHLGLSGAVLNHIIELILKTFPLASIEHLELGLPGIYTKWRLSR